VSRQNLKKLDINYLFSTLIRRINTGFQRTITVNTINYITGLPVISWQFPFLTKSNPDMLKSGEVDYAILYRLIVG